MATYWSAIAASLSALAAALGLYVSVVTSRGQLYESARLLHQDLTTGEVAAARDLLGRVRFDPTFAVADQLEEVRRAWFCLLWCFQRLHAGRERIRRAGLIGGRPLAYFDELVRSQLTFLDEDLGVVRDRIEECDPDLSDGESRHAFRWLVQDVVGRSAGD